jgi:O-antigen ligase
MTLAGIIITYLGVFFTASRSGMVLIFAAQALLILFQTEIRRRARLVLVFSIGLVGLWFLASNVINILETILPAVIEGSDTMGLRYDLWTAAWRMFKEKPITGVGIGVYRWIVPQYSRDLLYIRDRNIWVHNTYIQILAETGIVGFILFMVMFITAFFNYLRAKFIHASEFVALRDIWLIVFLVMLLGGITKSDHADKFTWMVLGLSTFFIRQSEEAKAGAEISSLSSSALPVDPSAVESHP